jgi:hypothetical protein
MKLKSAVVVGYIRREMAGVDLDLSELLIKTQHSSTS